MFMSCATLKAAFPELTAAGGGGELFYLGQPPSTVPVAVSCDMSGAGGAVVIVDRRQIAPSLRAH